MAPAAGLGGRGRRGCAREPAGGARRSPRPAGPAARPRRRGAARAGRVRRPGVRRVPAPGAQGRAPHRARRGRHRRRQDPRLHRPGQRLGREEPGSGVDQHVYPQPPAPVGFRVGPPVSGRGRKGGEGGRPQGPGELLLPAQFRRSGGPVARARRHRRGGLGADGALGPGQPRRRHGGRRLSGLAGRSPRPRADGGPHRQPRRVHLFGLRPLPEVLHRALDPAGPAGPDRRRQPRPGHGAGGARRRRRGVPAHPLRHRRRPSRFRRRRRHLFGPPDGVGGRRAQALDRRRRGRRAVAGARPAPAYRRPGGQRRRGNGSPARGVEGGPRPARAGLAPAPGRRHPGGTGGGLPRPRPPAGLRAGARRRFAL